MHFGYFNRTISHQHTGLIEYCMEHETPWDFVPSLLGPHSPSSSLSLEYVGKPALQAWVYWNWKICLNQISHVTENHLAVAGIHERLVVGFRTTGTWGWMAELIPHKSCTKQWVILAFFTGRIGELTREKEIFLIALLFTRWAWSHHVPSAASGDKGYWPL